MTPSKLAIQKVMVDRLTAALSVEVGTDPPIPGVEVGDDDETQVSENTNSVHTDVPHTLRARAYSETKAKEIGRDAAADLTDRSNLPQPSGSFTVLGVELTGHDMQRNRRVDGPDIYEDILLLTFRVTRS